MTRLFAAGALALATAIAQQSPGTFPAMQRAKADADTIARGKVIFGVNCVACHGADARGGQLNGPNLLRSQLVLGDKDGELIAPVLHDGRPERGMPAFPLAADDIRALVEFLHSLTAASPGQGAPPKAEAPPIDIVVGDAAAGRVYFASNCGACHAADGDLQGIATKVSEPKTLQNLWVSGGVTGRGRGRGGNGGDDDPRGPAVTATVTTPGGERVHGRVVFLDDFEIKLVQDDGVLRSFGRSGDVPRVEIVDQLAGHKALLSALTDRDMRNVTAYLVTLK
jgi:cytochrome c oxidase cbb3-type subunit 3